MGSRSSAPTIRIRRSVAVPSPTDTAEAFPGFIFVIAGLVPAPHLRAWHLVDGNFAELRLVGT